MKLAELENKVARLVHSDFAVNEQLFAAVWGWTYPLAGAAYAQYKDLEQYSGESDFTGSTDAAMGLSVRALSQDARFEIDVKPDRSATVRMTIEIGKDDEGVAKTVTVEAEVYRLPPAIIMAVIKAEAVLPKEGRF